MSSHKGNVRKNCYWGSLYSGWKMIFCKCEFVRFNWKKAVNLLLTTTMFHKNQNQTTEDAPFVSHTACAKPRLSIYFFQAIIPFYKKFHIFWNLKTSICIECHQTLQAWRYFQFYFIKLTTVQCHSAPLTLQNSSFPTIMK